MTAAAGCSRRMALQFPRPSMQASPREAPSRQTALTIGAKLNDGSCGLRDIKIETVVEGQLISRVHGGVQGTYSRTANGKRGQSQAIGRSKHLAPD